MYCLVEEVSGCGITHSSEWAIRTEIVVMHNPGDTYVVSELDLKIVKSGDRK